MFPLPLPFQFQFQCPTPMPIILGQEGLQPHTPCGFGHLHNLALMQYTAKEGLKEFGEEGAEAIMAELKQLYDQEVMVPVHKDQCPKELQQLLAYLMFLKKKTVQPDLRTLLHGWLEATVV
jgi:hypothetical protein